jgi:hypothetical protein
LGSVRSEVALNEQALNRGQRFCHDLAKPNLDEGKAPSDEERAQLLTALLFRVFEDAELRLSADRVFTGRKVPAGELRPVAHAEDTSAAAR